ncbi:DUF6339 family protein [Larkinella soli]|uniref:DUF6339 family protein n=1 Tax=Larkinella soli TaxID=1770527 RepID=UPI000FFB5209|nr:DUF6339 family protein [Larkinella soli]
MKILTNACCDSLLLIASDMRENNLYSGTSFEGEFNFLNEELPINEPSDVQLILNNSASADFENSKKIFEHFKRLNRAQASDRRIWVTLTHKYFFEYTKNRWEINQNTTPRTLVERFHFEGFGLATRMRNSISRLWWAAKITYDENRDDNYELTKLLWTKQDLYQGLVERSFGTYDCVVKGFLEFYSRNPSLNEGQIRRLFTGLNAVGGVKPLAFHTKDEIIDILESISVFYKEEVVLT